MTFGGRRLIEEIIGIQLPLYSSMLCARNLLANSVVSILCSLYSSSFTYSVRGLIVVQSSFRLHYGGQS